MDGIFRGIPWNFQWNSMEFYETEVDEIPWKIQFDGIRFRQGMLLMMVVIR
jgi:hypothetical protein